MADSDPLLPRPPDLHPQLTAAHRARVRKRVILLSVLIAAFALFAIAQFVSTRNIILELVHSLENLSTCSSCFAILVPLRSVALMGDGAFFRMLMAACVGLGIQDEDVCRGALGQQAPIIAHSLRNISPTKHTAALFCSKVFGLCPSPPVTQWNVPLPAESPSNFVNYTSAGKEPLRIVHISDIHIDREYEIGTETECSRVICCRNYGPGSVGPDVQNPAGPFGHRNCDTPNALFKSMLQAVQTVAPDALFMAFTGDVVDHAVWLDTQSSVTKDVEDAYAIMAESLSMPVFAAIGNHDIAPTNAFPRDTSPAFFDQEWIFDLHSRAWRRWIGTTSARNLSRLSGCYSTKVGRLKIISINTSYWHKDNFWLYDSDALQVNPQEIFTWMTQELQDAEDNGERVWLLGHVAPGFGDMFYDQSNFFDQIVQRYRHTITGQLYGHSHRAGIQIGYSEPSNKNSETATSTNYIAGSLVPGLGNPTFRVYSIDPDTYQIVDFAEYVADMSSRDFQKGPKWEVLYTAREAYGNQLSPPLSDEEYLSPGFWHRVTEALERNHTMYRQFIRHSFRNGPARGWCKNDKCKARFICNMRSARSQDNCEVIEAGIHVGRKRDVYDARERKLDILGGIVRAAREDPGKMAGLKGELRRAIGSVLHRVLW